MRRALLATLLLALALAPGADAAWFPSESIDGPSPDILAMSDVDTAQDGGSAVVYLKRTNGAAHVWTSTMTNGQWGPPGPLDVGQPGPSSDARVAVSDRGRAAAVWINDGRLWSAVREPGGGWSGPIQVHAGPVRAVSLGMSVHGIGYVAFSVGTGQRDVRAARLAGSTWTVFEQGLDFDPVRDAGGGRGPRIAAAADGTALAAWEEVGGDNRRRVFMRRVLRDRLSQHPTEASVGDVEGHASGNARNPEVGMDWDSSFGWVAFEQEFEDNGIGRNRIVGRRVIGVGLDNPILLDGLAWGGTDEATDPDIDVTGRRRAFVASELRPYAGVGAAILQIDVFGAIGRIDEPAGAQSPDPTVAHASNGEGAFAWHEDGQLIGRYWNRDDVLEPNTPLANADFGPAQASLGIDSSSNRLADVAIAFVQGNPLERRLVAAHWDRPLRAVTPSSSTQAWQQNRRPQLRWGRVTELWGSAQYRVEINGQPVATQASTVLDLPFDLPDGSHAWRIVTIDRRGQETPGGSRNLNIDGTKPTAVVATTGTLRAGQSIRFLGRDDPPPPADPAQPPPAIRTSGLARMTASFGDRTRGSGTRELRHVFRRKGNYRVRIVVRDRAGNQRVVKLRVRVANARRGRS